MDTERLFIAITFPPAVKETIAHFQQELKNSSSEVKWVDKENLHLTLKFLGDTPVSQKAAIQQIMQETAAEFAPFSLNIEGTGIFPGSRNPKVIWLGVKGDIECVNKLHRLLDSKLGCIGVPEENKKFAPHLTLGRIRGGNTSGLMARLHNQDVTFMPKALIKINSIALIKSELTRRGPVYTVVNSFQLSNQQ